MRLPLAFLLCIAAVPVRAAPAHVVVVIEENHSASEIIGSAYAPFINHVLLPAGRLYTGVRAVAHPSQPNYLVLFAGADQGVHNDGLVPGTPLASANLAAALHAVGADFVGYSEGLPVRGSLVKRQGAYARKHNPWSNWQSGTAGPNWLPPSVNQPFSAFPADFSRLPRVAFVIPDQNHDMHGTAMLNFGGALVREGDDWLRANLAAYAAWAPAHNSLLIVTWDENDDVSPFASATVPLIVLGAGISPGSVDGRALTHMDTVATIARLLDATPPGAAVNAAGLLP